MLEKTAQSKVYADDNIPFYSYLKISAKGVEEDDFVSDSRVIRRTNRLLTFNNDLSEGFQNYVDFLEKNKPH